MQDLASVDVLGADGLLAACVDSFVPRAPQLAMAIKIEQALAEKTTVVIEAGTGTGKTFAYLVPALLAKQKIIISTGTKNLQDQLFYRDLPVLQKTLGIPVKAVLLKGRSNYLCRYRLQKLSKDGQFISKQSVLDLRKVESWSIRTKDGDITTADEVAEASSIWPLVTSNADNCLGQECEFFNNCFLMKARRAAQEADLVIINHHLFFADLVLREEGFGEILPHANAVIFDEAHQLMDVASSYFGVSLSSRQLNELARDIQSEYLQNALDAVSLFDIAASLQKAVADMRLALGAENQREAWYKIAPKPAVKSAVATIAEQLETMVNQLQLLAERSKGLDNCWRRSLTLLERFNQLTTQVQQDYIHWYETFTHAFSLNQTPLNIAEQFRMARESASRTWIFTSATLAIGHSFEHISAELGLNGAECLQLTSPFHYEQQALLYLPTDLPEPQAVDYLRRVIETAVPVIEASRGRTFFLFTSHRALLQAADILPFYIDYPLLVQGTLSKMRLLDRYRTLGNAVLLGTGSFWEGVDVRGQDLSCVIIDKLPFAVPDDPLIKARMQLLRKQNKDPFDEYQLPQAVIALKQGAGRLIRDTSDTGVLMLCDPRLLTRPYGRVFLDSLPPMQITTNIQEVKLFYENSCH